MPNILHYISTISKVHNSTQAELIVLSKSLVRCSWLDLWRITYSTLEKTSSTSGMDFSFITKVWTKDLTIWEALFINLSYSLGTKNVKVLELGRFEPISCASTFQTYIYKVFIESFERRTCKHCPMRFIRVFLCSLHVNMHGSRIKSNNHLHEVVGLSQKPFMR